eukprot:gene29585-5940_t
MSGMGRRSGRGGQVVEDELTALQAELNSLRSLPATKRRPRVEAKQTAKPPATKQTGPQHLAKHSTSLHVPSSPPSKTTRGGSQADYRVLVVADSISSIDNEKGPGSLPQTRILTNGRDVGRKPATTRYASDNEGGPGSLPQTRSLTNARDAGCKPATARYGANESAGAQWSHKPATTRHGANKSAGAQWGHKPSIVNMVEKESLLSSDDDDDDNDDVDLRDRLGRKPASASRRTTGASMRPSSTPQQKGGRPTSASKASLSTKPWATPPKTRTLHQGHANGSPYRGGSSPKSTTSWGASPKSRTAGGASPKSITARGGSPKSSATPNQKSLTPSTRGSPYASGGGRQPGRPQAFAIRAAATYSDSSYSSSDGVQRGRELPMALMDKAAADGSDSSYSGSDGVHERRELPFKLFHGADFETASSGSDDAEWGGEAQSTIIKNNTIKASKGEQGAGLQDTSPPQQGNRAQHHQNNTAGGTKRRTTGLEGSKPLQDEGDVWAEPPLARTQWQLRESREECQGLREQCQKLSDEVKKLRQGQTKATSAGLASAANQATNNGVDEAVRDIDELRREMAELAADKDELAAVLDDMESERDALADRVSTLASEEGALAGRVRDIEQEVGSLAAKRDSLAEKMAALGGQKDAVVRTSGSETSIRNDQADVSSLYRERDELAKERDDLAGEVDDLVQEAEKLEKKRDGLAKERDDLAADLNDLAVQRDGLVEETGEFKLKRNGLRAEMEVLSGEREELMDDLEQLGCAEEEAGRKVGELKAEQEEAARELEQLKAEQVEAGRKLEQLHSEQVEAGRKLEQLKAEQVEAGRKLEQLHAEQEEAAKKLDELNSETEEASRELDQLKTTKMTADADMKGSLSDGSRLADERDELANENLDLVAQKDELSYENDVLAEEKDELARENVELATQRDELASERDQLVSEKAALVTERDDLAASKARLAAELSSSNSAASEAEAQREAFAQTQQELVQLREDLAAAVQTSADACEQRAAMAVGVEEYKVKVGGSMCGSRIYIRMFVTLRCMWVREDLAAAVKTSAEAHGKRAAMAVGVEEYEKKDTAGDDPTEGHGIRLDSPAISISPNPALLSSRPPYKKTQSLGSEASVNPRVSGSLSIVGPDLLHSNSMPKARVSGKGVHPGSSVGSGVWAIDTASEIDGSEVEVEDMDIDYRFSYGMDDIAIASESTELVESTTGRPSVGDDSALWNAIRQNSRLGRDTWSEASQSPTQQVKTNIMK